MRLGTKAATSTTSRRVLVPPMLPRLPQTGTHVPTVAQEDMLKDECSKNGWKWIVTRPNFILGVTKGNFMSLATTIALYASGCKAVGDPLIFPGSSVSYKLEYDHSTATNNAAFQIFAATTEKAYNRAFNIYDGKTETFSDLWPKIAECVYFETSYRLAPFP